MALATKSVLDSKIGIRFYLSIDVVTQTDLNNLKAILEKTAPNFQWDYGKKVEVNKNLTIKDAVSAAFIPLNRNAVLNETCRNDLEVVVGKVSNQNGYYMSSIVGLDVLQRSLVEKAGVVHHVRKKKVS